MLIYLEGGDDKCGVYFNTLLQVDLVLTFDISLKICYHSRINSAWNVNKQLSVKIRGNLSTGRIYFYCMGLVFNNLL